MLETWGTVALAAAAGPVCAAAASVRVRRLSGGQASLIETRVPLALYRANVASIHRARRALLDSTAICVAMVAIFTWGALAGIAFTLAMAAIAAAADTDLRTKWLPQRQLLLALAAAAGFVVAVEPLHLAGRDALIALSFAGIYFVIWFVTGGRMGSGDVWLAGAVALLAAPTWGWFTLLVAFNLSALIAAAAVLALLPRGRLAFGVTIPFGPALAGAVPAALTIPALWPGVLKVVTFA